MRKMEMPNPTTAAEWALACLHNPVPVSGELYRKDVMCVDCAESYARQQVEAAQLDWSCPLCHCCGEKRHDGDDPCVSCKTAVEAFRERAAMVGPPPCTGFCGHEGCTALRRKAAAIRALKSTA